MAKSDVARVLLDSSSLLTWITSEAELPVVDSLMDAVDAGEVQLAASTLALAELFQSPASGESWGARLQGVLGKLRSPDVVLCDLTPPVAQRAAEYRQQYRLRMSQAIHLATAVVNRCAWMVTCEDGVPGDIASVQVFHAHTPARYATLPWAPDGLAAHQPQQEEFFTLLPGNVVMLRNEVVAS